MAIWPFAQKSGQDTAVRGRLALSSLWTPSRDAPLKVRTGLVPDGGGVVGVTVGTMNVTVTAFRAIVQPGNAAQGAYPVVLDANGTITLPNGGGSPTPYTIGAIVEDSLYDASGVQQARLIAYATASPPANGTVIPLRSFTLRAGVSAGTGGLQNADLGASLVKYTTALGGIIPCLSTDRPANPYDGMYCHETDTKRLVKYNGTQWIDIFGSTWSTYTVDWSQSGGAGLSIGSGTLTGRYQKLGRTLRGKVTLIRAADTNVGSNAYIFSLPENAFDFRVTGTGFCTRGAADYPVTVRGIGASAVCLLDSGKPASRIAYNNPSGWTTGDQISFDFQYETMG